MLVKVNGMILNFKFFKFLFCFADEAELLAYVRDMHGKLYMIRQDDFKPLNYFLLVKAT